MKFILIMLFLNGVAEQSNEAVNSITEHVEVENTVLVKMSGVVTQTGSYCGGAAPSEEMLRRLATPVAYGGRTFYVIEGLGAKDKSIILDSATTDNDGRFTFMLAPGKYTLLIKEQLQDGLVEKYGKKEGHIIGDAECLKKWLRDGYVQIELVSDTTLEFNFNKRCFLPEAIPCLNYMGPYPP